MILEGKTLIVTGVGPGLGSEIVRCALRDGANVMLAARTEDKLKAMAERLDPDGRRVAYQATDITDESQCAALTAATLDRFGAIDALANVAALDNSFGDTLGTDAETWRSCLEVNVVGLATLVKAVASEMKNRGGGSIVLIGSQSSELPGPPQVAYASSKGAAMTAMKFFATDLGPHKIRVNTVIPTWMWGPPVQGYVQSTAEARGISEAEVVAEITANMPLGEIPEDDDVAEAVVFFCSDRASAITGQSLLVNAGEWMP
jgi:NAD(P)-dependent dehydrogenase (short-subunit alcohol dehydrogenase family)